MAGRAVVVDHELRASGLLCPFIRLVLMRVMADVLRCLLASLVLAVRGRSAPGELERQQQSEQQCDEPIHKVIIAADRTNQWLAEARKSLNPLKTTSKLAPMSAKTAIHMVALPNTARAKNTTLMPRAKVMFCQRIA